MKTVQILTSGILDLLFPPACIICGNHSREPVCKDCVRALPWINGPVCGKCGKPVAFEMPDCLFCRNKRIYFQAARALAVYEKGFRELVHHIKYGNGHRLVGWLIELSGPLSHGFPEKYDLISYIPMEKSRLIERGYNQAEIIALEIGKKYAVPVRGLFAHTRKIREQNSLCHRERKSNVRGAYALKKEVPSLKGKGILIVDDVFTTGATVNEAARILKQERPSSIGVFTLARTV